MYLLKQLVKHHELDYILAKDEVGYDFFEPLGFINDLSTAFYLRQLHSNDEVFKNKLTDNLLFIPNLHYLRFIYTCSVSYNGKTPILRSIYKLLLKLSYTHSLPQLELGSVTEETCSLKNIKADVEVLTEGTLKEIISNGIDYANIPQFIEIFKSFQTSINCNTTTSLRNNKCFKDVVKARKSSYVRPDLSYKIITQSLPVIASTINEPLDTIYILEDFSTSMTDYSMLKNLIYTALSLLDNPVVVYREKEYHLLTKRDKLSYVNMSKELSDNKSKKNFIESNLKNMRTDGVLYIITDCQDFIKPMDCAKVINILTTNDSRTWQELTKINNGQYFKIHIK